MDASRPARVSADKFPTEDCEGDIKQLGEKIL